MPRTEREVLDEIRNVHCQLSPENLSCDGEATRAQTRQRERVLLAALRRLESELGRKPTQHELWHTGKHIPANPIVTAGVYLELFHGREDPKQELDDWGTPGPVLGPFQYVHTTYGTHIKMEMPTGDVLIDMTVGDGLVYYDGVYYGDWSVFDHQTLSNSTELQARRKCFDQSKTCRA